jgi:hypothetical protein
MVRSLAVCRPLASYGARRWLDDWRLTPGYVWQVETAGTNALGMAVEERSPTLVTGAEHFADRLVDLSMAAAPFRTPRSGDVAGVVALTCTAAASSSLLLPLARRSAREVEERVAEATTPTATGAFHRGGAAERASLGWDSLTEASAAKPSSSPRPHQPAGRRPAVRVPPHGRLAPAAHLPRLDISSRVEWLGSCPARRDECRGVIAGAMQSCDEDVGRSL